MQPLLYHDNMSFPRPEGGAGAQAMHRAQLKTRGWARFPADEEGGPRSHLGQILNGPN